LMRIGSNRGWGDDGHALPFEAAGDRHHKLGDRLSGARVRRCFESQRNRRPSAKGIVVARTAWGIIQCVEAGGRSGGRVRCVADAQVERIAVGPRRRTVIGQPQKRKTSCACERRNFIGCTLTSHNK
jgi:hypothetical protein